MGVQEEFAAELARLRQRKRNLRPAELHRVLTRAGFTRRYGRGDHWVYNHSRRRFPLVIDPANPLKPAYVEEAVRAIREVLE